MKSLYAVLRLFFLIPIHSVLSFSITKSHHDYQKIPHRTTSIISSTSIASAVTATDTKTTDTNSTVTNTIISPYIIPFTTTSSSSQEEEILYEWFNDLIDSTPYFFRTEYMNGSDKNDDDMNHKQTTSFIIPLFNNATVSLMYQKNQMTYNDDGNNNFVIQIGNVDENDYGMICAKLYESQCSYKKHIKNNQHLKRVVKTHFSKQKPHTGYDAMLSKTDKVLSTLLMSRSLNENQKIISDQKIIQNSDVDHDHSDDSSDKGGKMNQINEWLQTLKKKGFVTIDTNLTTNLDSHKRLSTFLQKKTKQDSSIRSDTVAFLDKEDAYECGLEVQYEVLMGMASFLNENMSFDDTGHESLPPASKDSPLTNPRNIQAAEYGYGEFYVAHSDNLLANSQTRSNYRLYTCILYCNDDWDMERDGGELRIYPNTIHLEDPADVLTMQMEHEDINPSNGKLLIFDSRLVHSVEMVKSTQKKRLALTLWMMRPEDSGVLVDLWDEEKGEIDWYRLM